jgi:hypothetical protein
MHFFLVGICVWRRQLIYVIFTSEREGREILNERETLRAREREMAAAGGSREKRWSLAGATALVTGGNRGIGYADIRVVFV